MQKTIILAYHDIDTIDNLTEREDIPTIVTVVRIEEFESHMNYLSTEGYTVLSVKQYLDKLNRRDISDKDIVLTFDDGHISNHRYALPILRKYSFHATFFIIADCIGKPYFMGLSEIKELLECDMEIGSHTQSHSYLTQLKQEEVDAEVVESKKMLESCLGETINVFCYPGGHQNRQIVGSVREAGYEAAVSCITGRNDFKTNSFLLRRIELRRDTSVQDFQKAITPLNIILYQCVDMGKLFMKKTLGLNFYETLRQKLYYLYPFKR